MLLDLRVLLECLRAAWWDWSGRALAQLLRKLALEEVATDDMGGRRHFKSAGGLTCVVVGAPERPVRFEFPFAVPVAAGTPGESMREQFAKLLRSSVALALGSEASPTSWQIGSSTIAVANRRSGEAAPDAVALVISKQGVAEQADAADEARA